MFVPAQPQQRFLRCAKARVGHPVAEDPPDEREQVEVAGMRRRSASAHPIAGDEQRPVEAAPVVGHEPAGGRDSCRDLGQQRGGRGPTDPLNGVHQFDPSLDLRICQERLEEVQRIPDDRDVRQAPAALEVQDIEVAFDLVLPLDRLALRADLKKRFMHAGVAKIETERAANKLKIDIYTSRPGIIIGRKGAEIEKMTEEISKMAQGKQIKIDIQEIKTPELDAQLVAENVALGAETTKAGGFLNLDDTRRKIQEISDRYGFDVDPDALIEDLPVGVQQRVEIIKALSRDAEVLVFDEPTAVLTPQETDELMEIMRQLREAGKAIVFITHKLREVREVADRITVIRLGKGVGEASPTASNAELASMMVGRPVELTVHKGPPQLGDDALVVEGLTVIDDLGRVHVDDVSFTISTGEILAVAGVQGNGQTELTEALLGLQNQLWALVLIYPTFTVPFCTWLLMGFLKTLPKEVEESAMVDGCSRLGAITRVVLPLAVPGLLTVVIFALTLTIQEFVYSLTFISSVGRMTVSVGVPVALVRGDVYYWGSLMAACLITSVPLAILYNFFLDRFIQGITGGVGK